MVTGSTRGHTVFGRCFAPGMLAWQENSVISPRTVSLSEYLGTECMTRIKPTLVSSTAGLKRWCQGGVRHSIHARKIRSIQVRVHSDLSSLSTPFTTICSCSTRHHLDFYLQYWLFPTQHSHCVQGRYNNHFFRATWVFLASGFPSFLRRVLKTPCCVLACHAIGEELLEKIGIVLLGYISG